MVGKQEWIWPEFQPRREPHLSGECGFGENCRFYRTYRFSSDIMDRSLIEDYCQGEKREECRIRKYFLALNLSEDEGSNAAS